MARAAKSIYQTPELDLRTIDDVLRTTSLYNKLQHNQGLIDDIGMNMLAWTMSQLQADRLSPYSNSAHLEASYDWERLLRWKGRGPDSPDVILPASRIVSLKDVWLWFPYPPPLPAAKTLTATGIGY